MLKRLAILAVLALGFVNPARPQVPRDGGKQNEPAHKETATAKATEPLPATTQIQLTPAKQEDSAQHKPPGYPWKELLAPANVPNWILCLVGSFAGWAAFKTLKAIKRQADLMERQGQESKVSSDASIAMAQKTAEAALLNAQALINAERPWILTEIKTKVPLTTFTVYAVNKGRTPAIILAANMGCAAVKGVSDLPESPTYGLGTFTQDEIASPGRGALVNFFRIETLRAMLGDQYPSNSWDAQVFVFGRILYRDLLNPAAPVHETRWVGVYQPPSGEEGNCIFHLRGIGIGGEYEKYT